MIDIHAHILPDLDDGSEDMEESLEIKPITTLVGLNSSGKCSGQAKWEHYDPKKLNLA